MVISKREDFVIDITEFSFYSIKGVFFFVLLLLILVCLPILLLNLHLY
ncbi:hypothetical protein HMPREF0973_00640 [Prevotella veroralis F0319]|uniref:Uncharacterized protein n=1 Tax=Prevotella veroralis F0319 TaxID=649761 RepID=C9MM14_9BACT|nr:hypothetical protein HMPREF0973_00640 [Prevotella veroralis F0319]